MRTICKKCGKTFKKEWGLNIHNSRMHKSVEPKAKQESRPRMKYCCYCGEELPQ